MSISNNNKEHDWINWLATNVTIWDYDCEFLVYNNRIDSGYYFANETSVVEKLTRFEWNNAKLLCGFIIPAPVESNALPKHDPVNNPKHYDLFADGTQSMDILQSVLSPEEFKGFLKGNCLKYRLRAGEKDDLQQDIDKANWYKNKLAEVINVK